MALDQVVKLSERRSVLKSTYTSLKNSFIDHTRNLSPLHVAALIEGEDMCRRLVAERANLRAKCKDFGTTPMHCAALNKAHGLALIKYFSAVGLSVSAKDKFGKEPIHYAIKAGNLNIAKELHKLRHPKGDERSKNNLLHFCVIENNFELASVVLAKEPQMLRATGEYGRNALLIAAVYASPEMCKWLVEKGLDPKSVSKGDECSALHSAGLNKRHGEEIATLFVTEFGLDTGKMDKYGQIQSQIFTKFKDEVSQRK